MELFQYGNTGVKKNVTWLGCFISGVTILSALLHFVKPGKKQESIIKSQHTRQLFIFILKVDGEIFLKNTVAKNFFTESLQIPENMIFLHGDVHKFLKYQKILFYIKMTTILIH